jgi:hypothetical protein
MSTCRLNPTIEFEDSDIQDAVKNKKLLSTPTKILNYKYINSLNINYYQLTLINFNEFNLLIIIFYY